jgi:hypothetical protein
MAFLRHCDVEYEGNTKVVLIDVDGSFEELRTNVEDTNSTGEDEPGTDKSEHPSLRTGVQHLVSRNNVCSLSKLRRSKAIKRLK